MAATTSPTKRGTGSGTDRPEMMRVMCGDESKWGDEGTRAACIGIQVLSDLHLEFEGHDRFTFAPAAPYLVLAGDIGDPFEDSYVNFLHAQSRQFTHVFVVAGNHEFYGHKHTECENVIQALCDSAPERNCTFLKKGVFTLLGGGCLRVFGATLWYDPDAVRTLNDYTEIHRDDGTPIRGADTTRWCKSDRHWIKSQLKEARNNGQLCLVITHHAPRPSRWRGDGVELRPVIQKQYHLPVWIHGHTHRTLYYTVDTTLVVSNQLGYYYSSNKKDAAFRQELVVYINPITGETWMVGGQPLINKV
ncbi:Ser/Thr phosphatase family superfamily protein [Pelomyxa schiedti]|nr:Ser/Thr phosphatase family superfamily protein [Pelomyxa schiedti]